MKIQKVEIKGLFGKKDIEWQLNPQVNVLVGENGSGKSTILSIIYSVLTGRIFDGTENLINYSEIFFAEGRFKLQTKGKNALKILQDTLGEESFSKFKENNPSLYDDIIKSFDVEYQTNFIESIGSFNIVEMKKSPEKFIYYDIIEANLTNSNANHIIQKSNQETTNALDMEIRETIYELNKIQSKEVIDRLILSLNVFFNQIGKNVIYQDNELIYTDIQLQKQLNYSDLSSGERQLIYILLRVALSNKDKNKTAIILIDEPEISLHVNWQADFIKQLTLLNPDAQFIIVTHSPAIIMNGWNDVYVNMEEITQ